MSGLCTCCGGPPAKGQRWCYARRNAYSRANRKKYRQLSREERRKSNKPREVEWLCKDCHQALHRKAVA